MPTIAVDAIGSDNGPGEIVRGGAPLLGFERLVIKAHGRSRARVIENAVKVAAKAVRDQVPEEIAAGLSGASQ